MNDRCILAVMKCFLKALEIHLTIHLINRNPLFLRFAKKEIRTQAKDDFLRHFVHVSKRWKTLPCFMKFQFNFRQAYRKALTRDMFLKKNLLGKFSFVRTL